MDEGWPGAPGAPEVSPATSSSFPPGSRDKAVSCCTVPLHMFLREK